MSAVTILDIEKICCVCLRIDLDMNLIFESEHKPTIAEMLSEITIYKIQPCDELPHLICSDCLKVVISAFQLKQQCEKSYRTLMGLLKCEKDESQQQFSRRARFPRHFKAVHKIEDYDLDTSREDKEDIKIVKLSKNATEETESDKNLYNLWQVDNLQDKKHLENIIDEEEKPLADLLNTSASSAHTIEDVLNESIMEDDNKTEKVKLIKSKMVKQKTKIIQNNLNLPKRRRGRPPKILANCKYCNESYNDLSMLQQHLVKYHIELKDFPCTMCGDTLTTEDDYQKHFITNHKDIVDDKQLLQCNQCNTSFADSSQFTRHKESHSSKSYQCSKCVKSFCTNISLQRHLDNHDKKRYVCKACSQQFDTREELNNHAKEEGHDKPLLCPECGLRCRTKNIFAVHMRRHNGEKPFKCKFCSKGFPRIDDLKIHEKYHTGEKSHFCEICGKGFLRKYNLRIHLRVHTGEKPYKCPHCPQAFAQSNDLKAHIRRHTGERFRCEICAAEFLQAYQIRQHKLQEHDIHEIPPTQRVKKFTSPEEQEKQIQQNLKN